MADVWIISGEVHQQDPAFVVAMLLIVVMELDFNSSPMVCDAFALLTGVIVIDNEGRDRRTEHLITQHMIDSLVSHDVAGDPACLASLADQELLTRCWLVGSIHEILLQMCSLKQLVHLEELSLLLEAAASDGLLSCFINNICIIKYIHNKTTQEATSLVSGGVVIVIDQLCS